VLKIEMPMLVSMELHHFFLHWSSQHHDLCQLQNNYSVLGLHWFMDHPDPKVELGCASVVCTHKPTISLWHACLQLTERFYRS
jgi:hypothetical protein